MEAVQYTYDRIAEDADLIVQHFDNGVPWPEALDGAPFAQAIQDDWAFRRGSNANGPPCAADLHADQLFARRSGGIPG
ncbi:MAG: hypothetical protein HND48_07100 [Chloroflexi bacterium]|nr:hypothetical protein [Chloroflexota bacterium]